MQKKHFSLVVVLFFLALALIVPKGSESYGFMSLIPATFLLLYIFLTKRILESLVLASLIGYLMKFGLDFFGTFNDSLLEIMLNEDIVWLMIVCGLMGSIIALIEKSGGAYAFGRWVSSKARTRKSTLLWTWLLGIVIFIDDYLNSLTVGSCMTPITDKHKVSREYLAYIVDSTAAPVCVLVPVSTWAIFIASLIEQNGLAPSGQGILYYIKALPYNFYAWVAVLIVPLVILGIVPLIGPMKAAERRAQELGILAPEGSEKIDIKAGEKVSHNETANLWDFFLPIVVLILSTILFGMDLQKGVLTTIGVTFVYYLVKRIMTPEDFVDNIIKGIKNMLLPLIMVILAYLFANASEHVGFIDYMIELGKSYMTPELFPFIVFLTFGITEFIMGISWGMYVIALPIVIPLSLALGANPFLAIGAVCSAGVWGSHMCFYSDATILSSAASGCDNYRHAITQIPYGLIAASIAGLGFLVAGYLV